MSTSPKPAKNVQGDLDRDGDTGAGSKSTDGSSQGRGVVKRTTSTVKRVLLVVIGALIALFAVFNSQEVSVRWIFGEPIQSPLILVIAVTLVAGIAIGWIGSKLSGRQS